MAKILLVDDVEMNLELLEGRLQGAGYATCLARNGAEALQILGNEEVQLIISDILMPKMDGYQLCRKIKLDENLRRIPFLFYTATYTEEKDREFALSLGAEAFVIKPTEKGRFMAIVSELLARSQSDTLRSPTFDANEDAYFREYNERLVNKLEKKVADLEIAKSVLRSEFERSTQESEANVARLEALLSIAEYKTGSFRELTVFALEKAIELTGSRIGYCYFVDNNTRACRLDTWMRKRDNGCEVVDVDVDARFSSDDAGILADAIRQRRPWVSNRIRQNERGAFRELADVERMLTIPVIVKGEVDALIGVANKASDYLEIDERQLKLLVDGVWNIKKQWDAAKERRRLEAQLRQAQKMEAVGRAASTIAHDFKNYLSGIIGLIEVAICEGEGPGDSAKLLSQAIHTAERASEMVQEMMVFSRGDETISAAPLDLHQSLDEIVTIVKSTLCETIQLETDLTHEPMLSRINAHDFQRIMLNLYRNAEHAVQDRAGIIGIKTERRLVSTHPLVDPGAYNSIRVTDNGCGIPDDVLPRITEPFFTTRKRAGTGLGLAVVHGISQRYGGGVEIRSRVDEGTSITVLLPAMEMPLTHSASNSEVAIPKGDGERVVLIDDEAPILRVETALLQSLGYIVTPYMNSMEAYQAIMRDHRNIDLVVTDGMMEGLTGREIILRLGQHLPNLPIVLLSPIETDLKNASASRYLTVIRKPIIREEMARVVSDLLSEARSR